MNLATMIRAVLSGNRLRAASRAPAPLYLGSYGRKDRGGNDEQDRAEREAKELKGKLDSISDALKKFAEEADKKAGALNAETKASVDKLLTEQGALGARLAEVEQKLARAGQKDDKPQSEKSLGTQVIESEPIQALMKSGRGRAEVSVKLISGLTAGAGGALVDAQRLQLLLEIPRRRLTIRDLITPGRISTSSFEYVRQTGFTNAAAIVAETAAKPESNLTFDLVVSAVATIAHWMQASRQILADAPQLQSFIDGQLRYGLKLREEAQLLKGSGVSGNLNGIYTQATAFDNPLVAEIATPTRIDMLRLAMLQAELAEFPPTGITMHPTDWAAIELQKDDENRYLWANPQQLGGPTMWGLPVVPTKAHDVSEFVVGAWELGAQIFDREDAIVLVSTEDRDNFIKNLVTVLCEERLGLAVYRPEAFVKGDFTP